MDLRQHDITEECDGTCAWLLEHPKYCNWLKQFPALLWIKGKPGAGKSTLMKYALRETKKQQVPDYTVASFFFHGRGASMQRTALGLFRSLLHQILTQIRPLLSEFQSMFQEKLEARGKPEKDWNWHEKELQDFFKSNVAEKGYRIRIFIDALDECGEDVAEQLMDYFQKLTIPTKSALSICFSCRHYPRIGFGNSVEEICVEHQNQQDISTYIQARLKIAFKEQRNTVEILEKEILNKASGIFQWVDLVVSKTLTLRRKGKSMKNIQNMLLEVPAALDELYRTIFETINEDDRPQTLYLMQWICLAKRPLSLTELRFAMASDWPDPLHRPHQSHHQLKEEFESDEQMEYLVRSLSGGLVEVKHQKYERTVQLIHQSVNDFLIQGGLQILDSSNGSSVGQGHHRLSRSCINYATLEDVCKTAHEGLVQQFPFLEYAVTFWIWHAERAESENISQNDLSVRFKWPSNHILQRWIDTYRVINRWYDEHPDGQATLLHITSRYGLLSAVKEMLLEKCADVDCKDKYDQTPLSYAAENGHETVVKLLLEKGANVNGKSQYGQTPLSYAAENGHEAVVKLLLEKGADVDFKSKTDQTPLSYAAENGHEAVVKLLLEKGADVDFKSKTDRTPLSYAAENGHETVVKLLLEKGADVNSESTTGRTPLSYAAKVRHETVVKLLLEKRRRRGF
jgi:ankyrin repeat protein